MTDPAEGPAPPLPPLFLDQIEARKAAKNLFSDPPLPPPLFQGLDNRASPYVKVWIRHHRGQTSKSLFLFFIAGISFTS